MISPPTNIPKTTIYLRDKFTLQPNRQRQFAAGVRAQIQWAASKWKLVAACADQKFPMETNSPSPPPMMHIWKQRDNQWSGLYDSMYDSSELNWYTSLEQSILQEHQDLLVNYHVGYGVQPHPACKGSKPEYVYRYQEVRLKNTATPLGYLAILNWFAEALNERGWSWVWSASQVTGEPAVLCFLWCSTGSRTFDDIIGDLQRNSATKQDYNQFLSQTTMIWDKTMYPLETECW